MKRTRRAELRRWLTSVWAFAAALMVVMAVSAYVVAGAGDQVDTSRHAQIMLAELESDAADVQRALAALMAAPAADIRAHRTELADEREDLRENVSELVALVGNDELGGLHRSLRSLQAALSSQLTLVSAGELANARTAQEETAQAFEEFDDAVGAVSDAYEESSTRLTKYADVVLWSTTLFSWLAIVALSWWHDRGRRASHARIQASRERFRTLAEAAFEGVAVTRGGEVVEASASFAGILGLRAGDTVGAQVLDFVEPASREPLRRSLSEQRQEPLEATAVRADGRRITVEIRTRPGQYQGEPVQVTAIRDITERKLLEEQLQHQALHDALTGLSNRTLFGDRLEHALTRGRSPQQGPVALLFLDLDDFKVVNDSLGHQAGDQLLVATADRLRGCLRPADTVARLGGDEFGVILLDVEGEEDATRTAERILKTLRSTPVSIGEDQHVFLAASIGVAVGIPGTHSPTQLLRDADLAMYEAKALGKGRHSVFRTGMEVRAADRLQLENDLRQAVQDGRLEVHYQPVVDMTDGRVLGVEALLRWDHPERGWLPPTEFIPIAEQSGLIVAVGQWVLEQSCRDVATWQRRHPGARDLTLNVNISAGQLHHPELVQEVTRALDSAGLAPGHLTLEITESVLLSDLAVVSTTLARLRSLGVRLAIDDFGTGYSSLSYLKHLDSDFLKIDKSFVDELAHNLEDEGILRSIVAMADALGITCVAEGVEHADQHEVLRRLGCSLGQGFHFHRPAPAGSVDRLLGDLTRHRGAPSVEGAADDEAEVATPR